jgi:hypothetical protein
LVESEAALDLGAHVFRCRGRGIPELPEFAVLDGGDEGVVVVEGERVEFDLLALENDWLEDGVHTDEFTVCALPSWLDEATFVDLAEELLHGIVFHFGGEQAL